MTISHNESDSISTDTTTVDKIADILAAENWDGAADILDAINEVIAEVRPNPGAYDTDDYADLFAEVTGRDVITRSDAR